MAERNRQGGFTLIEMSLVLVIVGLVIMIVFPALTVMRQTMQQSTTTHNLASLMRATAAFVQANGCLPCPTPASTLAGGFGRVRGDTANSVCGTCSVAEGITPFVSLGLPASVAHDGWGRWITMRVDPALTVNFGVVPPTTLCTSSDPAPCVSGQSRKGLCQPNLSTANRVNVLTPSGTTQQAAVLFVSHGANGFGAFHANPLTNDGTNQHPTFQGSATICSATGGYERCNADGDASFVHAQVTNDTLAPFDDILVYLDRNALVTHLGNLACQSAW